MGDSIEREFRVHGSWTEASGIRIRVGRIVAHVSSLRDELGQRAERELAAVVVDTLLRLDAVILDRLCAEHARSGDGQAGTGRARGDTPGGTS